MSNLPKDVQRRLAKLEALEAGGVDNWEWYGESLKDWREQNHNEETAESIVEEMMQEISVCIEQPAGRGAGFGISKDGQDICVEILLKRLKEFNF